MRADRGRMPARAREGSWGRLPEEAWGQAWQEDVQPEGGPRGRWEWRCGDKWHSMAEELVVWEEGHCPKGWKGHEKVPQQLSRTVPEGSCCPSIAAVSAPPLPAVPRAQIKGLCEGSRACHQPPPWAPCPPPTAGCHSSPVGRARAGPNRGQEG